MAGKSVEYQVAGAVARLNSDMAAVVQRGVSLALEGSRRNSVTLWGFARGELTYELWPGGHSVGVTLQWKSGDGNVRAVGQWRSGAAFLRACDGLVGVAGCVARVIDAVTRESATADRLPTRAGEGPADPPMGYGYRQDRESGKVYALRWGQSGRITGALSVVGTAVDPETLDWDKPSNGAGHADTVAWARSRRWDFPVTP